MMEDELIKIWQSSSNQERIKFEKSRLMIELQSSIDRLNRWWKYRVIVEIVAAFIVIPTFSFIAYWIPFATSKISSVLIIIYVVYIIARLIGVKKFKPNDLEENYLDYLKKSREYLDAQKNLIVTSIYWGTLPWYPIIFLFIVGFWEIPSKRYMIILLFLSMVCMHIYGYFSIKRRIKNDINPRIERVDELIKTLKE